MSSAERQDTRFGLRTAHARARGEGAVEGITTTYVSNEIGAAIAAVALWRGIHPTVLTWGNIVCSSVGTGAILFSASSPAPMWGPGWLALVFWPLAYAFDCADGQVARVSGRKSEYGARVDVLADYASHIIVMAGVLGASPLLSLPLTAVVAGMWLFGTMASSLRKSDVESGHGLTKGGPLALLAKSLADTGLVTLVVGAWVLVSPANAAIPMVVYGAVNALYFCLMIARESRLSFSAAPK